ncbi:uncharacterized protein C5orf34 homolog [Dunckerocampus dactyliophorus]|uniref:uncharacterized protein C5orf34 homolog n=1 Tax=Dunckerocampus dactyliophorus TaxID=161453 RepID=UPI0024061EDD|nr:uncharacterized protein C5orf34 homolog [Dunckerocampus dactyliophorus]
MMEADSCVPSWMVMYEDESVDICYKNGTRLQFSPCGCEFMLVKGTDPSGHPLQTPARARQRTRFTISAYKDLIIAALAFRNKYASRPYLPEELIPVGQKQPLFNINVDVQWPKWSSCEAELGPGGETTIRSEDKRTVLMLAPSGEEFSVEFLCRLSQPLHQQPQHLSRDSECSPDSRPQHTSSLTRRTVDCLQSPSDDTPDVHHGKGKRRDESVRARSCSPQMMMTESQPEGKYQCTTLIQHHSCHVVEPTWHYPLSLARRHWTARLSNPVDGATERTRHSNQTDEILNTSNLDSERKSLLPPALPLTCPSPHWHSWRFQDPVAEKEQSNQPFPTELVKVIWHQGVTYRILGKDVSIIEVLPGDGSVIRSNGVLSMYFTHYKPDCHSTQANVKEVTYHLNSLPPDIPGQLYSICSVVSCASRILANYNEAKTSLMLSATPSCLLQESVFSKLTMLEGNPSPVGQHKNDIEAQETWSDFAAAELAKIKPFNFLLENSNLQGRKAKGCAQNGLSGIPSEPVSEGSVAEALQRTSAAIQDIDAFITTAKQT